MLGDPLEILRPQPVLLRGSCSDRDPGYSVFRIDLQCGQRITQQMQSTNRHRGIKSAVHLLGLDARCDQLTRDAQAAGSRVAESESAGVSEKRHVESARDV